MKTVKLGVCLALALAFAVGVFLPIQEARADVLDTNIYKARLQGVTRFSVIDALTGERNQVRIRGDFYFKLCSPEVIAVSECNGEVYLTAFATADLDESGVYGDFPGEIFFFTLSTCGNTEQTFINDLDILDADPETLLEQQIFSQFNGTVRDNGNLRTKSKGGGIATYVDLNTILSPDGVTRRIAWKANVISVDELPENLLSDLVLAGFFLDLISEIPAGPLCFSEVPEVPVPAEE